MSSEFGSSSGHPQSPTGSARPYAPLKLACTPCRTRRVKCDHERPACGACSKSGIACEFPSGRKRKRTKTQLPEGGDDGQLPETASSVAQEPVLPADGSHRLSEGNIDWLTLLNASTPAPLPYAWTNVFGSDMRDQASFNPLLADTGWQMPSGEPSAGLQLISALQTHVPTLHGNPREDQNLQLYYYRFSGPTAIQPGIHRINLRLQRRLPDPSYTTVPQPETEDSVLTPVRPLSELFDDEGMPMPHVRQPLFELFYRHLSQHFPAISRRRMDERFESGTMSAFLANCICACAARFSEDENVESPTQLCAPFIAKAQEVIVSLTQLPTTETTSGLILLAWASYGQGNESGLWQWSGMAVRMGLDIGIHEVSEIYDSQQHVVRTRLLFWTLFITDRIISFSAGRQTSINEDIIEIPLPEDQDFFPDPARDGLAAPHEAVEAVPFVSFVRLMVIVGRISNVLNGRRGKPRTLVQTSESQSQGQLVADLQVRLVQFYSGLPDSLRWTSDNFKHQDARGHGGMFLALHLWAHAVLALTYHPTLLQSPSGNETPLKQSMSRDLQLALVSSRQINECMVFADLVNRSTYICTPYLVQPLFVGTMAMMHEIKALESKPATANAVDVLYSSMARQNLGGLIQVISRMAQVWAGADTVLEIIEKRTGLRRPQSNALRNVYISLPDMGLLRRFKADKNHPNNVAQPTETSLRESIARSSQNGPSPLWLQDLMSTYSVENMSLEPIGAGDLADLLSMRNE